jgi:DNA (cytosine-5)-methyltransferase 1
MRHAYYNEIDPCAAQWLRNLIAAGHIADGDVDERSIADVRPDDLRGYRQCHFFAGIGGWSLALRLAGVPDDAAVWTGSCPCQPFSAAGKGKGTADDRHLWHHWFALIDACRPGVLFGEQVSSAIRHGWLDLVCDDLEGAGYTVRAAVAPAGAVGAPHRRERLWFVADADGAGRTAREHEAAQVGYRSPAEPEGRRGLWDVSECHQGEDGKVWFVNASILPLAHGIPGRVGRLRAYGNAIVPQVAAEFIRAVQVR